MGDHDTLFKRAFGVPGHAAAELRSVLPAAIVEQVDLGAVELLPASFVDAEMAHRHVDLLFRCPVAGRPGYLYLLLEHQSEPDPLMPWRVLTYLHRIWAAVLRAEPARQSLPPVVGVVVHHGEGGWTAPRQFHDMVDGLMEVPELRRFVPAFELLIDDVALADDRELLGRPLEPFPKVALWLLRDGRSLDAFFSHLAAWAGELERLVRQDRTQQDVLVVLRYILRVAGDAPFEVVRQRVADIAPALEAPMASAAEQLIQQGMERGLQQGLQQGKVQALRGALSRLLNARFGALTPSVQQKIDGAMPDQLERWIERVVTADRLDEIFAS